MRGQSLTGGVARGLAHAGRNFPGHHDVAGETHPLVAQSSPETTDDAFALQALQQGQHGLLVRAALRRDIGVRRERKGQIILHYGQNGFFQRRKHRFQV